MITKQINFNKKIKDKQNYAKNYNCRGFVSFQAFYFKIFVNKLCKFKGSFIRDIDVVCGPFETCKLSSSFLLGHSDIFKVCYFVFSN